MYPVYDIIELKNPYHINFMNIGGDPYPIEWHIPVLAVYGSNLRGFSS